jgi:hypothetical protein
VWDDEEERLEVFHLAFSTIHTSEFISLRSTLSRNTKANSDEISLIAFFSLFKSF